MKFKHVEGKVNAYSGTGTLIGKAGPGKYMLLSVAHNFRHADHELKDAMLVLHRQGLK